jgi:multidrug efflux pump subunit AcrA (membrane-fusion protein)
MSILPSSAAPRPRVREVFPGLAVPAAWLDLALHAGEPDFFPRLLDRLRAESGATSGGVWLLVRTARGHGLAEKAASGLPGRDAAWSAWLRARLQEVIAERQPKVVPAGPGTGAAVGMLVPLAWEGAGFGIAWLGDAALEPDAARRLALLAGWAARLHGRRPVGATLDHACAEALLASAHSADWPAILTTHLRRQSGARRAALLREERGEWRLVADSNAGEVQRRSSAARDHERRMARALAATEPGAVALRIEGAEGWGALLDFDEGHAATEPQVRRGLAGVLQIAARVLPQFAATGWRVSLAHRLLRRARLASPRGSRWALALLAALGLGAMFLPVTERFEADCELQPVQRFTVAAEVEGRIRAVPVAEGAVVKAGETIAELDATPFRTRLEVAREQRQEQEAQARRHQGEQDMTGYRLARLKGEQAAQEEASLLEDIRHCTVVAPIDGRVLTKDLPQKLGAVLRPGDTVCEIGSLEGWNLQIALREEDLETFLRALEHRGELPVAFRLKAGSTFSLRAAVTSPRQISEMAYPHDGRNVLYVTVPLAALPAALARDLRPGFSGRAKIDGERHPWGRALTRRFVQAVRLRWWL